MNQDLWLKALHFHGAELLQTILSEEAPVANDEAKKEKLQMCQFIKSRLNMLFKQQDTEPGPLPEHSIPIVPIELFQNAKYDDRRDLFYKSLDRGHILILRVINDRLPDHYKLLVLCKEENHMKLDDLSIVMYLPKLPSDLELAGGKLEIDDLIRAAVWSCNVDERKLYITIDSSVLEEDTQDVKLGKISVNDLPFYLRNDDVGASYSDYLCTQPTFHRQNWAEDLYNVLGLKRNYLYSFMGHIDGKTYSPVVCAEELRKKQAVSLSTSYFTEAQKHYLKGEFPEAVMAYNKALEVYPRNIEALVARGTIYANKNNIRKAIMDMEAALKMDSTHVGARKQMSILLVAASRLHIEQKNLDKAQESLDAALDLDSSNKDAVAAIEEIRKLNMSSDKPEKATTPEKNLKKTHVRDKSKKSHHRHHKSRSKSPRKSLDRSPSVH